MRVSVYKGLEGAMSILVEASVGSGLVPVMIPGITRANLQEKVLPVVEVMRRPGTPQPDTPLLT